MSDDDSNNSYDLYLNGMNAAQRGDIDSAIVYLTRSLEASPHFRTYEKLFELLRQVGRDDEAAKYIEMAYRLNPTNNQTAFLYARDLLRTGNKTSARPVLEEILKRNPACEPTSRLLNSID